MTGPELKQLRHDLGAAIGRRLSVADMAKLCGLAPKNGADTWRKWEEGEGPSGPVGVLVGFILDGLSIEGLPADDDYNTVIHQFFANFVERRLDMRLMNDWQPINTAPRDGSDVLLWDGLKQVVARWDDNGSDDGIWIPGWGAEYWPKPTHWRPILEPPS